MSLKHQIAAYAQSIASTQSYATTQSGLTIQASATRVQLDAPRNHVFQPGDILTGQILSPPSEYDAGFVRLLLEGRCKTKVRIRNLGGNPSSTYVYRGRGALLYEVHDVFPGEHGDWRFAIPMPANAQLLNNLPGTDNLRREYWDTWRPKSPFKSEPGAEHPLPPSFSGSDHGFHTRFESYIEYSLTVADPDSMPESMSEAKVSRILFRFHPAFPQLESLETDPQMQCRLSWPATVRTLRLRPGYEARSLTLKEKTMSVVKSSDLPSFEFAVHLCMNGYSTIGQRIDCGIRLEPKTFSEGEAQPQPIVNLVSLELELLELITVRGVAPVSDYVRTKSQLVWQHIGCNAGPFEASEGYTRKTLTDPLPLYLPPSFSTYNIAVSRTLSINVVVECAGVEQRLTRKAPFTVLSEPRERPPDSVLNSTDRLGNLVIDNNDRAELPSYVEAPSGAPSYIETAKDRAP